MMTSLVDSRKFHEQNLATLKELFQDTWCEDDLLSVLEEFGGDLETVISRISEGHVKPFSVANSNNKKSSLHQQSYIASSSPRQSFERNKKKNFSKGNYQRAAAAGNNNNYNSHKNDNNHNEFSGGANGPKKTNRNNSRRIPPRNGGDSSEKITKSAVNLPSKSTCSNVTPSYASSLNSNKNNDSFINQIDGNKKVENEKSLLDSVVGQKHPVSRHSKSHVSGAESTSTSSKAPNSPNLSTVVNVPASPQPTLSDHMSTSAALADRDDDKSTTFSFGDDAMGENISVMMPPPASISSSSIELTAAIAGTPNNSLSFEANKGKTLSGKNEKFISASENNATSNVVSSSSSKPVFNPVIFSTSVSNGSSSSSLGNLSLRFGSLGMDEKAATFSSDKLDSTKSTNVSPYSSVQESGLNSSAVSANSSSLGATNGESEQIRHQKRMPINSNASSSGANFQQPAAFAEKHTNNLRSSPLKSSTASQTQTYPTSSSSNPIDHITYLPPFAHDYAFYDRMMAPYYGGEMVAKSGGGLVGTPSSINNEVNVDASTGTDMNSNTAAAASGGGGMEENFDYYGIPPYGAGAPFYAPHFYMHGHHPYAGGFPNGAAAAAAAAYYSAGPFGQHLSHQQPTPTANIVNGNNSQRPNDASGSGVSSGPAVASYGKGRSSSSNNYPTITAAKVMSYGIPATGASAGAGAGVSNSSNAVNASSHSTTNNGKVQGGLVGSGRSVSTSVPSATFLPTNMQGKSLSNPGITGAISVPASAPSSKSKNSSSSGKYHTTTTTTTTTSSSSNGNGNGGNHRSANFSANVIYPGGYYGSGQQQLQGHHYFSGSSNDHQHMNTHYGGAGGVGVGVASSYNNVPFSHNQSFYQQQQQQQQHHQHHQIQQNHQPLINFPPRSWNNPPAQPASTTGSSTKGPIATKSVSGINRA